jgi:AraC-like DNA-binding protein
MERRAEEPILRPVTSVAAFTRSASGVYLIRRSLMVFSSAQQFSGVVFWGEPEESDILLGTPLFEARLAATPHPSLVDARHITRVDPLAFGLFAAFATRYEQALSPVITKLAVLHGDGVVGAVAAGFAASLALPFPVCAFRVASEALEWLAPPIEGHAVDVFEEVERLVARSRGGAPLLGELAALLEANPNLDLAGAAAKLALSTRSLQRKLRELETSFQNEIDAARVRVARRLLADSHANVARVALAVGMSSPRALARVFRRVTGHAPAALRDEE